MIWFLIEFCSLSSSTVHCSILLSNPPTVMNQYLVQSLCTRSFNKYCFTLGSFYVAATAEKHKSAKLAHIHRDIHR